MPRFNLDREATPRTIEQPKVVATQKKRPLLLEISTLHLIPVTVTSTFLALHAIRFAWASVPDVNTLNALQFAAKVYESWIVASLSYILFDEIRYRLTVPGSMGLRFGMLVASYQLSSPVYLFNKEFRSAAVNVRRMSLGEMATLLLFVYFFSLAAASGPSTAIAILPKLDWRPWRGTSVGGSSSYDVPTTRWLPMQISRDALYPVHIPSDITVTDLQGSQIFPPAINLGSFQQAWKSVDLSPTKTANYTSDGTSPRAVFMTKIDPSQLARSESMFGLGPGIVASAPIDIIGGESALNDYASGYIANTSLSSLRLRALASDAYWTNGSGLNVSGLSLWKQPLVLAHCGLPITPTSFVLSSMGSGMSTVNLTTIPQPANTTANEQIAFLDPGTLVTDYPHPISISLMVNRAVLCLVSSHWIDAEVFVTVPGPRLAAFSFMGKPQEAITFNSSWLATAQNNSGSYTESISSCKDYSGQEEKSQILLRCAEAIIAFGVVDRLAGLSSIIANVTKNTSPNPNNNTGVSLVFEISQYVYGYGFSGITTYLAFGVLLLHALTVVVHMINKFAFRKWSGMAWDTMGQLVVLALRSPSTELLANTAAGAEAAETWRLWASIRELGDDNRIGLVFQNENGGSIDQGARTDERATSGEQETSFLRADVKYS
jgi:hypothetical protein